MRFARLAASAVFFLLIATPIRYLLRRVVESIQIRVGAADVVVSTLAYLGVLVAAYVAVLAALWVLRLGLRMRETWEQSGLSEIEASVRGAWPKLVAMPLAVVLVVAAVIAGGEGRLLTAMEMLVFALSVVWAVGGEVPHRKPEDEDPLPRPLPMPGPEPAPTPRPSPEDSIPLSPSWYFHTNPSSADGEVLRFEMQIDASRARYDEFVSRDHDVHCARDYGRFVGDGMCDEVSEATRQLRGLSQEHQFGTIAEINNVLAYAQRYPYELDSVGTGMSEYPKFPLEMMVDDKGDCEDHAILAAACLLQLGYDVRLVDMTRHMALAVAAPEAEDLPGGWFLRDSRTGKKFYYCEVTTGGSSGDPNRVALRMGYMPEDDRMKGMELVEV